ncbi:MAG: hypothetical protein KDD40_06440 [Bdellovibrionales bacterium]|nr:hypothetical protein [Bdellovibrionales bacterium]MCB0356625.1 hypothetical protein [Bdellovibrionales bacterium]
MVTEGIVKGYILPGLPHILMCPEKNAGWMKVRKAFDEVCTEVQNSGADLLVIYSTYWASILGHQIQANPEPQWIHVDDQFHDLGSIPYKFKIDTDFAEVLKSKCEERGLHARTINYEGFPIDTGSVVALKLINPDNKIPAVIVSSNIYSDRAESIVYGKAVADALKETGKKAVAIAISSLSNRLFTTEIDPQQDKIHSLKDQEWNDKFLELLSEGRLEDCSQLSRQFHREARVKKVTNFKPFWWLAAVMGQTNAYAGDIKAYAPMLGTGAAVISLTPGIEKASDLEYDEEDVEVFLGDRNVLDKNLPEQVGFPTQDLPVEVHSNE